MLARAAALRRRHRWRRVGVKAAVGAQADEDGNGGLGQALRQLRRVVAGVEDEQGRWPRLPGAWLSRALICSTATVLAFSVGWTRRTSSGAVQLSRVEAELGQPLVRPPGDDRLPGRVAGGMVVKAALRTGLGVAAGPDAQVDGVDRLAHRWRRAEPATRAGPPRRGALGQGIVEAAPAAAVCGLQAEVGQRGDRLGRQQGIDQLEQGVGAAREAAVQGGAEGAEGREVMSGHAAQLARTTGRRPAAANRLSASG